MKKGGKINILNLVKKNRIWVLIIIYVLFIYVSLPFFPAFISVLRSLISKEVIATIHHIDMAKFGSKEEKEFNERDFSASKGGK